VIRKNGEPMRNEKLKYRYEWKNRRQWLVGPVFVWSEEASSSCEEWWNRKAIENEIESPSRWKKKNPIYLFIYLFVENGDVKKKRREEHRVQRLDEGLCEVLYFLACFGKRATTFFYFLFFQ